MLAKVIQLWRIHSDTLGFMPDGGFEDAAARGELLAAATPEGDVAGYAMFRSTARGYVVLVHLCVGEHRRGQGLARLLVEGVRVRAAGSYEIRLRCRRDFSAHALWPKLGFLAVAEEPARAANALLTIWRLELATLPLLEVLTRRAPAATVAVAIDANVFFDLGAGSGTSTESCGLQADWLRDFVEPCVTGEILNEIDRCDDPVERARQRARVGRYRQLGRDLPTELHILPQIESLLPQDARLSTASDARQLAMSIAGGVTYFVTRDTGLLDVAIQIEERFGMVVLSPHEVINRFDELRREEAYRPRRIFLGPRIRTAIAKAGDVERVVEFLHEGEPLREPRRRTTGQVKAMLALPDRFTLTLVEQDGSLFAAYVVDVGDADTLRVPYFAVAATALGRTAARHYAEHLVALAARLRRRLLVVGAVVRADEGLRDAGFWEEQGVGWTKLAIPLWSDTTGVAQEVEDVGRTCAIAAPLARRIASELRALPVVGPGLARPRADLVALERTLWPAKISETGLPCFIVPIQPRWAKDLFDRELAEGTLFGANPQLALNSENVYYRAARPSIITAPARVLWYVSHHKSYPGSMAVRACSYVDDVVIGEAKDLFRRFRRLGVYEWSDVLHVADGDPRGKIMAFRFSKTEPFSRPVAWNDGQALLEQYGGRRSQLQGPTAISEACFLDFYRRGTAQATHAA